MLTFQISQIRLWIYEMSVCMNYFIYEYQRKGTCYLEFYKGKWDNKTFWKKDSILIDSDIFLDCKDFVDSILKIIPTFDPFGVTEISYDAWKKIGKIILRKSTQSQEIYYEADELLKNAFAEHGFITILGV